MKPLIFAHRGASGYAPENTLVAFRKAIELGADGIECDIQMTQDGELIIYHDEILGRTADGKGYVKTSKLGELRELDAGSWFNSVFTGERIPLLEELLDLTKDTNLILNIELKNSIIAYHGIEEKLIKLLKKYDMPERIIVSSFNHESIAIIKGLFPGIKTGMLYECPIFEPWGYAKKLKVDALHPISKNITEEFVRNARENALEVNTFTVNGIPEMERVVELGVTGIITNYPDVLRSVIEGK